MSPSASSEAGGPPAMSPVDYVSALYQSVLRRDPDAEGLAHWTAVLAESGDPTAVLAGLLSSDEYSRRFSTRVDDSARLARRARHLLARPAHVVDVGAQSLEGEDHVYAPLSQFGDVNVTGFEPLMDRLEDRARTEAGDGLILLPHALGDGERHRLHVNNDDATSSLFPLNVSFNAQFTYLASLRTVESREVVTRRLDDVLPPEPIDLMKLDVQGAELMILEHSTSALRRTAVIHCEVEFAPIYQDQPLFGEVAMFLHGQGFSFVDFVTEVRYECLNGSGLTGEDRLLWADAVFMNDRPQDDMLAAQAFVLAALYGKVTIAASLLDRSTGSGHA